MREKNSAVRALATLLAALAPDKVSRLVGSALSQLGRWVDTLIDIKQSVLGRKMASNHGYYWRNSHIPIDSISMKACFYNRDQNALSACKATAHNVEGCFLQAPPIQAVLIRPQSRAGGRREEG